MAEPVRRKRNPRYGRHVKEGLATLAAIATIATLYLQFFAGNAPADKPPPRDEPKDLFLTNGSEVQLPAGLETAPDSKERMVAPGPEPSPATENRSSPNPPAPLEPTQTAVEPSEPVEPVVAQKRPPPPPDESANCPAPSIAVAFSRPGNISGNFSAVTSTFQVEMIHCTDNSRFRTRFARDQGSLEGLSGSWGDDFIRFDFGYISSFGGRAVIRCSVSADAVGNRRYSGSLSCTDDDNHDLDVPRDVTVRL